jgi:hypothetical protein
MNLFKIIARQIYSCCTQLRFDSITKNLLVPFWFVGEKRQEEMQAIVSLFLLVAELSSMIVSLRCFF